MSWVMIKSGAVLAIAILIVPLIDTLSVIIIRLMKKESPMRADRNHIHHRILRLGFNHFQTTLIICSANIFIIVFAYLIRHLNLTLMFVLVVCAALFLSYLPLVLVEVFNKKRILRNQKST